MTGCALVCTRNGADRLPETLRHLFAQQGVAPETFRIVVIDNRSTDDTAGRADALGRDSPFPFQVVRDTSPGKWSAVLAHLDGPLAADLVTLVDDDNWLCPDFIARATGWFAREPRVVLVGSHNEAVFPPGVEPPAWFEPLRSRYACSVPNPAEPCRPVERMIVPGAGSTFRRAALAEVLRRGYRFINDAVGDPRRPAVGEDLEFSLVLAALGGRFVYDPALRLRHAMTPARLTWPALRRLCRLLGTSCVGTDPFMIFAGRPASALDPLRAHWTWQAAAKLKRLLAFGPALLRLLARHTEGDLRVARMEQELGALQRILHLRGAYTAHLRHVHAFLRNLPAEPGMERIADVQ